MRKAPNQFIYTASGQVIDPEAPRINQIRITDIVVALSKIRRYNGHYGDISVLDHSVALALIAKELGHTQGAIKYALFHDAAEAYMGDMPTWLKPLLGHKWHELYSNFDNIIMSKFNVTPYSQIDELDKLVVEYEMDQNESNPYPVEHSREYMHHRETIQYAYFKAGAVSIETIGRLFRLHASLDPSFDSLDV